MGGIGQLTTTDLIRSMAHSLAEELLSLGPPKWTPHIVTVLPRLNDLAKGDLLTQTGYLHCTGISYLKPQMRVHWIHIGILLCRIEQICIFEALIDQPKKACLKWFQM